MQQLQQSQSRRWCARWLLCACVCWAWLHAIDCLYKGRIIRNFDQRLDHLIMTTWCIKEKCHYSRLSRSLSQLTEGERHPGRWPVSHWQTDTGTFIPTDNLESPANLTPVTTWPASNSANHHTHINPIKPTWFMKRWQRGKHHIYSSIFTEQRWSAFIEQVRCGHSISASS